MVLVMPGLGMQQTPCFTFFASTLFHYSGPAVVSKSGRSFDSRKDRLPAFYHTFYFLRFFLHFSFNQTLLHMHHPPAPAHQQQLQRGQSPTTSPHHNQQPKRQTLKGAHGYFVLHWLHATFYLGDEGSLSKRTVYQEYLRTCISAGLTPVTSPVLGRFIHKGTYENNPDPKGGSIPTHPPPIPQPATSFKQN